MLNFENSRNFRINYSILEEKPNNSISNSFSKLPKKYLDEIYRYASNKTTREIVVGLIAIKINKKQNKNNELNKNGTLLSISKSKFNNILGKIR